MPKETTHRDPETRAARIERRAKKRADTVARKKIMKMHFSSRRRIPMPNGAKIITFLILCNISHGTLHFLL